MAWRQQRSGLLGVAEKWPLADGTSWSMGCVLGRLHLQGGCERLVERLVARDPAELMQRRPGHSLPVAQRQEEKELQGLPRRGLEPAPASVRCYQGCVRATSLAAGCGAAMLSQDKGDFLLCQ